MNVIFYLPGKKDAKERIYRLVKSAAAKTMTEVFRSIRALSLRLSRPADNSSIAVLLARTEGDLDDLVSIRNLFFDVPIILILPYREDKTTSIGYRLGPRFLTYMDANLDEVSAVLEKMITNHNSKIVRKECTEIEK